jgi:hypothetical protein
MFSDITVRAPLSNIALLDGSDSLTLSPLSTNKVHQNG